MGMLFCKDLNDLLTWFRVRSFEMILIRIYASDSLGTAKSDVDKDSSVKQIYFFHSVSFMPGGGGVGVLPYMGYIGMCRWEGYGFQAVYSRIGYINQSIWL